MVTFRDTGTGPKIRGYNQSEDFLVSTVPRDEIIVPGIAPYPIIVDDATLLESVGNTVDHEFDIDVMQPISDAPPVLTNDSPSVISLEGNSATRLTDGIARVLVKCKQGTKFIQREVSRGEAQVTQTFQSWLPGSLAKHASDNVDGLIAGQTPTPEKVKLWSTYSVPNPNTPENNQFEWNPEIFTGSIDFSCISPWNSRGGAWYHGCLISPRHAIGVAHIANRAGDKIQFVAPDNTKYTRTVLQRSNVYVAGKGAPDVNLMLLDSDLPGTVKRAKMLPSNWRTYIPSTGIFKKDFKIPIVRSNQFKTLQVSDLRHIAVENPAVIPLIVGETVPYDEKRFEFYYTTIVGDSGSPSFMIINGEAVLICCLTWGGNAPIPGDSCGGGYAYCDFIDGLNAAIASVDTMQGINTGYTVSTVNLSGFNTY